MERLRYRSLKLIPVCSVLSLWNGAVTCSSSLFHHGDTIRMDTRVLATFEDTSTAEWLHSRWYPAEWCWSKKHFTVKIMYYWAWSVFSSNLSSWRTTTIRKHNDLQCMNLPHFTVCTSSQNQEKLSISDSNTQDTHQITLPTCPVDHTQYFCQTPSYQIYLSNCRQFCSPIVPLFQWCHACVCICIAGFYLGFSPMRVFFTFRFLLSMGFFPWSV